MHGPLGLHQEVDLASRKPSTFSPLMNSLVAIGGVFWVIVWLHGEAPPNEYGGIHLCIGRQNVSVYFQIHSTVAIISYIINKDD